MCVAAGVLAGISLGVSAIGAGVSAYGSYKQQSAANQAYEYNAQMSERNSQVAKIQADQTRAQGETAARNKAREVSLLQGSQRAGYAGGGILVDSDTAYDIGEETAVTGALDSLTLKQNARKQAWAYDVQAQNYSTDAAFSRSKKVNPWLSAGTSLLTSSSNMLSTYALSKQKTSTGTNSGTNWGNSYSVSNWAG